jgi:hypothetical protein
VLLPPERLGDFNSDLLRLPEGHTLLISSKLLGHGGERNAFVAFFLSKNSFTTEDEEWVVKESRHERAEHEDDDFHRKALVTQHAAHMLAKRFNDDAEALEIDGLPSVSYMNHCFIKTGRVTRRAGEKADPDEIPRRSLFAERKIEGTFRKWNTTFGAVVTTVELDDEGGDAAAGDDAVLEVRVLAGGEPNSLRSAARFHVRWAAVVSPRRRRRSTMPRAHRLPRRGSNATAIPAPRRDRRKRSR